MLALEGDRVLGPQPSYDGQDLFEPRHALLSVHAERVELRIAVAQPHAEDHAAAGHNVERRDLLGDVDGILHGQDDDIRAHEHVAGFRTEARQ